jgi:hypothetical protein
MPTANAAEYTGPVTETALLSARGVRIDEGGVPVIDHLEAQTTAGAVVILGAPRALFAAVAGLRDVSGGTLHVAGLPPVAASRSARIASAPLDGPLPGRWTVLRFVTENARLAGLGARAAQSARTALEAMQLTPHAQVKLARAALAVRRAAMIAAALATEAEVLIVEDFSPGLGDDEARGLARVFVAAVGARRWMLFAGRLALASPLGIQAEEALVFSGSRLLASGPPAEIASRERTLAMRVHGAKAGTYAERLRERGATVQSAGSTLTVTMPPELTPRDLVLLAKEADVVVLELAPLAPALL